MQRKKVEAVDKYIKVLQEGLLRNILNTLRNTSRKRKTKKMLFKIRKCFFTNYMLYYQNQADYQNQNQYY